MKLKQTVASNGTIIEESSGNVFADLGLPDAPERQLKSEIAMHIGNIMTRESWTQAAAAARCGLTQPKMNDILRGRLRGYSVERLLLILNRLGRRVEVRIARRECPPEEAKTSVVMK